MIQQEKFWKIQRSQKDLEDVMKICFRFDMRLQNKAPRKEITNSKKYVIPKQSKKQMDGILAYLKSCFVITVLR